MFPRSLKKKNLFARLKELSIFHLESISLIGKSIKNFLFSKLSSATSNINIKIIFRWTYKATTRENNVWLSISI